ncbi:hypothetical protein ACGF07_08490 [Kitasatospora sp. NPDC048194]|uniref:hypothetical protein n=1 Tax=Kitasatospora sp. NPDC048194 TaxID=3364045 RepID=UPI003723B793
MRPELSSLEDTWPAWARGTTAPVVTGRYLAQVGLAAPGLTLRPGHAVVIEVQAQPPAPQA